MEKLNSYGWIFKFMWKIKQIFDGDFGCEEPASGEKPNVSVTLENEEDQTKFVSVGDPQPYFVMKKALQKCIWYCRAGHIWDIINHYRDWILGDSDQREIQG